MRKVSPNTYAEAFVAALVGKHDHKKLIERFIASIQKHNDWSKRYQIIRACEKKLRERDGRDLVTIESARELSAEQKRLLTDPWKSKHQDIEYRVNSSLIAGAKIVINEERQLDGSLRRKLAKIFSIN